MRIGAWWIGSGLIYAAVGTALAVGMYLTHLRDAQAPVLRPLPTTEAYPQAHALALHHVYVETHNGVTIHFWVDQPAQSDPPFVTPADTPTPVGWAPQFTYYNYGQNYGYGGHP